MSKALRTILMLAVVASFSLVAACGGSDPVPNQGGTAAPAAQTKKVVLWQYRFNPASTTIAPGDTIIFENKDPEPHNVSIGALNVDENIAPGATWSYQFNTAGEYAVGNRLAENPMNATIVVK